jgi:hypothetical protein
VLDVVAADDSPEWRRRYQQALPKPSEVMRPS